MSLANNPAITHPSAVAAKRLPFFLDYSPPDMQHPAIALNSSFFKC
jgi:hypothetical protein